MSSFLNLFRKRKTSQYADPNKVMEDLIKSDNNDSLSSRSNVSNSTIDSSFSDKSSKLTNSGNSSSVLNMPMKKGSLVENLYGILEEHIIDNIGGILNVPEGSLSSRVSSEDFQTYVDKLKGTYNLYVKERDQVSTESFDRENIDSSRSLIDCYSKISPQYFDSNYCFNFYWLDQDPQELAKFQATLEEHIDQINLNLCNQISEKFGCILGAIQDLTEQENKIGRCLEAIRNMKEVNKELKEANTKKVVEVLRMKKKQMNMQRTIQILEMVNIVKKIIPTLQHLIQRNNFEYAVSLLNSSEQTFKEKLNLVKGLQSFQLKFQEARTTLQQLLIAEFEKRALDCLNKCLTYQKVSKSDDNNDEETLKWTINELQKSNQAPEQISKIILAHIKLKDVSLSGFRPKLHDLFKNFHKQFTDDMNDYLSESNPKKRKVSKEISPKFEDKIQFVNLYFKLCKTFFIQFSEIHNKVVSKIVDNFETKLSIEGESSTQANDIKILTSTIHEFISIYSVVVRNFNDKLAQIIQLVDLKGISSSQFLKFLSIFEEIIFFFKETFATQQEFHSSITTNNEALKKALHKILLGFVDQMSISPLINLKLITEKQFIQTFFMTKKENLLRKLGNEKWQAVEISQESFENLKLLHENVQYTDKSPLTPNLPNKLESQDECVSPLITAQKQGDEQTNNIQLKKKALLVNGKSYKITESYLELAQTISELYTFSQNFPSISEECISKIFALAKVFSSSIDHDILKGNSNASGGVITPEMLAFTAVSLQLLKGGLEILFNKLGKTNLRLESEINQYNFEVENLINQILTKISEILRDVVFIEKSAELKSVNWSNSQENVSFPTAISIQILEKIKGVNKTIMKHLLQEHLAVVYELIIKDLLKHYMVVFEELDVKNCTEAKNVKSELDHFILSLKQILVFADNDQGFYEIEEKVRVVLDHKCIAFIELASLDDETNFENGETF